jgi:hypothetical protein
LWGETLGKVYDKFGDRRKMWHDHGYGLKSEDWAKLSIGFFSNLP